MVSHDSEDSRSQEVPPGKAICAAKAVVPGLPGEVVQTTAGGSGVECQGSPSTR